MSALNRFRCLTLPLQQDQSHETALAIDQQEEESLAVWGRWLDGLAEITVYKLQQLTGTVGCLRRKRGALLLADETPVAQPVHALDCW